MASGYNFKEMIGGFMYEDFLVDRGFVFNKFDIEDRFFDKIAELLDLKYENFRFDVVYTPEELIGFYTWSEMTPHERDLAVIVLRQLACDGDFPLVEASANDGVMFRVMPTHRAIY